MLVSQYFVEFIFYSFLGWIWESIYCTLKEKQWADRGFLFGPICPIYGSCVVVVSVLFQYVPCLNAESTPVWVIFGLSFVGSAVAEYSTSWFLEKRFHARWWDYSDMPLHLNGRICLPASMGFGFAGIVVVKILIPALGVLHSAVPEEFFDLLGIILAAFFGADFALTEASLSTLLQRVEEMKGEFNDRAATTYIAVSNAPRRIEKTITTKAADVRVTVTNTTSEVRETITEKASGMKDSLTGTAIDIKEVLAGTASSVKDKAASMKDVISDHSSIVTRYARSLNSGERAVLRKIKWFMPGSSGEEMSPEQELKEAEKQVHDR